MEVNQAILLPDRGEGISNFIDFGFIPNRKRVAFVRLTNKSYRTMIPRYAAMAIIIYLIAMPVAHCTTKKAIATMTVW